MNYTIKIKNEHEKFNEFHKINEEGSPSFYNLKECSAYPEFSAKLKQAIEDFSRTAISELSADMGDTDNWKGFTVGINEIVSSVCEQVDFVLREVVAWVSELSSSYLDDTTKSFLYECDLSDPERMNCQYVLKDCLEKMMKVLGPMTPFLAEDAYQNYLFKKEDSLFMEEF